MLACCKVLATIAYVIIGTIAMVSLLRVYSDTSRRLVVSITGSPLVEGAMAEFGAFVFVVLILIGIGALGYNFGYRAGVREGMKLEQRKS